MEELEFSRRDIERLVGKLLTPLRDLSESELSSHELSAREKNLLLAIFWAAAEQVAPVRPQASPDLDKLREQLVESFLPDSGEKFMISQRRIHV
jgi:hypothetical protein